MILSGRAADLPGVRAAIAARLAAVKTTLSVRPLIVLHAFAVLAPRGRTEAAMISAGLVGCGSRFWFT